MAEQRVFFRSVTRRPNSDVPLILREGETIAGVHAFYEPEGVMLDVFVACVQTEGGGDG